MFIHLNNFYTKLAGLNPLTETAETYNTKCYIDFDKKVLVTPKSMWTHETKEKLRNVPGVIGI